MSLDERTGKASEDDKPISSDKKSSNLVDLLLQRQVLLISLFQRETIKN
jgi:hypothetical protein